MLVAVVYNPVSGDRTSKDFFDKHVFPLLEKHNIPASQRLETEYAGHAGTFVKDLISSSQDDNILVVLGSGDGTLHEIVNSVSHIEGDNAKTSISLALVPCGTANALYSSLFPPSGEPSSSSDYKLQSLNSYLNGGRLRPLTLTSTTLSSANGNPSNSPLIASVVVSTALHASILHDSEKLRESIPGIERFKIAAQENSTRWYQAKVELLPIPGSGVVQVYDPSSKAFIDAKDTVLEGPFGYFLSTVNVDRLEPAFRITPLAAVLPPQEASIEVVVLRPFRDPSISSDGEEERKGFAMKAWAVMGGAYRDGEHVDMRYDKDGLPGLGVSGDAVVEYYRCGGWTWTPDESDERAHLVCTDGYISQLEKGRTATCSIGTSIENEKFTVYV